MRRRHALLIGFALLLGCDANAQSVCGGSSHYRWKQKVETPRRQRIDTVKLEAMLSEWPRLEIAKRQKDFCAARQEAEKKRIVVTGYLWRIKRSDDDGDHHLELTASKSRFSERC